MMARKRAGKPTLKFPAGVQQPLPIPKHLSREERRIWRYVMDSMIDAGVFLSGFNGPTALSSFCSHISHLRSWRRALAIGGPRKDMKYRLQHESEMIELACQTAGDAKMPYDLLCRCLHIGATFRVGDKSPLVADAEAWMRRAKPEAGGLPK
jgi:hypothetical protein